MKADGFSGALATMLTDRITAGTWRVVAIGSGIRAEQMLEELGELDDAVFVIIDASKEDGPNGNRA